MLLIIMIVFTSVPKKYFAFYGNKTVRMFFLKMYHNLQCFKPLNSFQEILCQLISFLHCIVFSQLAATNYLKINTFFTDV